ncbi:MAG TPA: c-type cytochrome [Methylomirabilota bacterium]|nr:c-type cytochrome [Methylomirabilota bacterium]
MKTRTRVLVLAACSAALVLPGVAAGQPMLNDVGATKAITCAACHGKNGNSRSSTMPILAGMDPAYFKKQMEAYAKGDRPSAEMEPYAKQVLDIGADDLAAHFARQKRAPTPISAPAAAVERGRAASQLCVTCHGQDGRGDRAKLIPSLAGQPPGYLKEQMLLFRSDERNPKDQELKAIKAVMKRVPDAALDDLAAYYSSLR